MLTVSAEAVWSGTKVGPVPNIPVTVDLGSAGPGNFGILATGDSNNVLSLTGGVYNGNLGTANLTPTLTAGTLNGSALLGDGLSAAGLNGTITGGIVTGQSAVLSTAIADAAAASAAALSLKRTLSLSAIDDAWFGTDPTKTISGGVGTTVLRLSSINLTQGQTLKLSAPVGGSFVIVVNGAFNLSNSASITVDTASGLLPLDVLYALGSNTSVTAHGSINRASIIDGIILASAGNVNITYGQVNGEVIGSCDLVFNQATTSAGLSPIPEVSSFFPLFGILFLAVGGQLMMKRRSAALAAE